ncbi:hypothetical protein PC9H_004699 [Pleurotus ostreatus]|uniref:RRM domain-containing protein n=1 Tax=Pleurotus ostreatus TaxID=5322 RepID=A0A8H7DS85_PLEOS|nr:uncharacterized protein PC9H_004699 [Pleurotus ostreatus]KAF7432756.1 hypothetical protein PC9H_004699 [Pleurotus ostreatus]KAJ8698708.1 Nucleolar protein 13 [Pleurotus ostreatus]
MSSSSESDAESSSSSSVVLVKARKRPAVSIQVQDDDSASSSSSSRSPSPEVPVVSHAEKRKQKKKQQKVQEAPPTTEEGNSKGTGGSASTTLSKRQNSVWVGNLSFKTTQDDLRTFFSGAGEITRINLPTKKPNERGQRGENRGFAYVDFATPEAKVAAIALSEKPLTGRKLLIKDGNDYTGRPAVPGAENVVPEASSSKPNTGTGLSKTAQKILRAQKQPPAPTLFFGNLGFETTDVSLRAFLEAHRPAVKGAKGTKTPAGGENSALDPEPTEQTSQPASGQTSSNDPWIRKVRMGTFEDSGLCKGFAFVDFTSIENATTALINPRNHQMDGRRLVVEYASAEAVRRGGGPHAKTVGTQRGPSKPMRPSRRDQPTHHESDRPTVSNDRKHSLEHEHVVEEQAPKKPRTETGEKVYRTSGKRERVRPKPGAALALAKRESAAIIPSQGKKIVF